MTGAPLNADDLSALSSAAGLLDLVGHCAPDAAAEASIHALRAADLAAAAGASITGRRMTLTTPDVRAALVAALHHLSRISEPAHADDAIADVSDAAQLADARVTASQLWAADTGRATQLTGTLGDVVGRLHDELTQSDRWATAIGLGSIARQCGRAIAASGPYGHVTELAAVRVATSRTRRAAELSPPDPTRCIGMTRPIPLTVVPAGLRPAQVVYESVAEILDLVHRSGRAPLTIRQMSSVCRAAETVVRCVEKPRAHRDLVPADGDGGSPANA